MHWCTTTPRWSLRDHRTSRLTRTLRFLDSRLDFFRTPVVPSMPSFFDLPREIRDDIWARVLHGDKASLPYGPQRKPKNKGRLNHSAASALISPFSILQASRRFCDEAAPYVYENTAVYLLHPYQALRWILTIGPRNASYIRHLVLKFTSLEVNNSNNKYNALDIWHLCLRLLTNLVCLTFDYEPYSIPYSQANPSYNMDSDLPIFDTAMVKMLKTLTVSAKQEAVQSARGKTTNKEMLQFQPPLRYKPITHAAIAIEEPMPSVLILSFIKLITRDSHCSISSEEDITCLPTCFLADHRLLLSRTYIFTEDPEKPSIVITYRKLDLSLQNSSLSNPRIETILSHLPRLLYLRLGCRYIDSSFLAIIPPSIQTLDVAFTDPDPERVAAKLQTMRQRCEQLYTLAIAVSPLHDALVLNKPAKRDQKPLDYQGSGLVDTVKWEPFWQAIRYLQGTGVRVWEGEGPGFRRVNNQANATSQSP